MSNTLLPVITSDGIKIIITTRGEKIYIGLYLVIEKCHLLDFPLKLNVLALVLTALLLG